MSFSIVCVFFLFYFLFSKNFKAALKGYVFKTVSELAACKHLPKIICATRSHITGDAKTSTHANELFIVRKIGRTTVMRKHVLKAYSLKTNEVKILQVLLACGFVLK